MNNKTRWELMSLVLGCVAIPAERRKALLAEMSALWLSEDAVSAGIMKDKLSLLLDSINCMDMAVDNSLVLTKLDVSTLELPYLQQLRSQLNSAITLSDKRVKVISRLKKDIIQLQKDIFALQARPALLRQLNNLIL